MATILVIDDNETIRDGLAPVVKKMGHLPVVAKHGKGTTFGNVVFGRYLAGTDFVRDASGEAERRKFETVLEVFRRFGERYG